MAAHPPPLPLPPSPPPLAALIPDFPRIGGQPLREWIGAQVPQLPGFNGDDLTRMLLADVQRNPTTSAIIAALLVAFLFYEGELLFERWQRDHPASRQQQEEEGGGGAPNAQPQRRRHQTPMERLRHERRRGLYWLSMATAVALWCTGLLNRANPFQP